MIDPVAFRFASVEIRWYGVFAALAFVAGYSLVKLRARTRKFKPETVDQLVLWLLIGGLLGARGMYVATHWGEFQAAPLEALKLWKGGLVFYGGFVGAFAAAYVFALIKQLNKRSLADLAAPALPLGHAVGRIGCFLNGCCFGKPYDGPLAVHYPDGSYAAYVQQQLGRIPPGIQECLPVFPAQLATSASNLLLFAILLFIEPRMPRKGQLFALYVALYAIFRFGTEFVRGDYLQLTAGMTPAQIICLFLFPVAVASFVALGRMKDKAASAKGKA